MENRHVLIVDAMLTPATGTAEPAAALAMRGRQTGRHRATLGADKAYDVAGLVADLRTRNVTPHIAQNTSRRRSAIDSRTTRHSKYAASQRGRKRIEESFGWMKTTSGLRKTRHRGTARSRLAGHADCCRLQPGPAAQAPRGDLIMPEADPATRRTGPVQSNRSQGADPTASSRQGAGNMILASSYFRSLLRAQTRSSASARPV
jgi:hypothetical protein